MLGVVSTISGVRGGLLRTTEGPVGGPGRLPSAVDRGVASWVAIWKEGWCLVMADAGGVVTGVAGW